MSLQYIIDGYNVIKHPLFVRHATKRRKSSQYAFLDFVRINRLCGSPKNKVIVVFDGYPDSDGERIERADIEAVFSKQESADERIKKIIEKSDNPKNFVVVSDDKEIKLFASYKGSRCLGVEEFIRPRIKQQCVSEEVIKPELTYSQISKINKELKRIWLK